jgi:hypothetical protein
MQVVGQPLTSWCASDVIRMAAVAPRQILGFETPSQARRAVLRRPMGLLVNEQGLHPSADVTATDWLGRRLRRFGSAVAAVVPDGFPATFTATGSPTH